MASAISIAAQAPNSEQSLESLSFKAFHRNIKSRFLRKDFVSKVDKTTQAAISREELAKDIMEFTDAFSNLTFYLRRLHNHDFETEFRVLTPGEAIRQALKFIELRETILHRYPLFYKNGKKYAENISGENGCIKKQCSFFLENLKHRQKISEPSNVAGGAGNGIPIPKYQAYVIYGNFILLCPGYNENEALKSCTIIVKSLS